MICAYYLFINHPCIITILLNSKKLTVQKFNPIQAIFNANILLITISKSITSCLLKFFVRKGLWHCHQINLRVFVGENLRSVNHSKNRYTHTVWHHYIAKRNEANRQLKMKSRLFSSKIIIIQFFVAVCLLVVLNTATTHTSNLKHTDISQQDVSISR